MLQARLPAEMLYFLDLRNRDNSRMMVRPMHGGRARGAVLPNEYYQHGLHIFCATARFPETPTRNAVTDHRKARDECSNSCGPEEEREGIFFLSAGAWPLEISEVTGVRFKDEAGPSGSHLLRSQRKVLSKNPIRRETEPRRDERERLLAAQIC
jgi:hypothetical protein